MSEGQTTGSPQREDEPRPHHIRLPGFILHEEIGLGDVIKRTTTVLGVPPCDDCARRAAALNRWLVFSRPRSK